MNFDAGQIIRFTYNSPGEDMHSDKFKEVFVLNGDYIGKVHGLDLKLMTPANVEVIEAIMDPNNKGKVHRIPLVNDILKRMDPLTEIKNPVGFYAKFVRPFMLSAGDVYRTYWKHRMVNATVVKLSSAHGHTVNPKPLFHDITPKAMQQQKEASTTIRGKVQRPKVQRPKRGKLI